MLKEKVKTAGRFCTVGVGNTLIDFGVFFLLAACHVPYLPAQICSYSAGIINSYVAYSPSILLMSANMVLYTRGGRAVMCTRLRI